MPQPISPGPMSPAMNCFIVRSCCFLFLRCTPVRGEWNHVVTEQHTNKLDRHVH